MVALAACMPVILGTFLKSKSLELAILNELELLSELMIALLERNLVGYVPYWCQCTVEHES